MKILIPKLNRRCDTTHTNIYIDTDTAKIWSYDYALSSWGQVGVCVLLILMGSHIPTFCNQ